MKISSSSAWPKSGIGDFLSSATMPIRIAAQDNGYPLICSVWYHYDSDREVIYCVSHQSSYLVKLLKKVGRCAFEIAPNEPPYLGVRGKAKATVLNTDSHQMLESLINRYLDDTNSELATWLLGRSEEELIIELSPQWITSWDYSARM
jgi:nitroimidazol reductase NimA-like FMN-containing flavoprotein (pyridoxamine 5'-phosphate oxidase superfamily)